MPPPNLPFWHVDCSEQKAIKNQETQEKLFYLSLNCLKELYRGPVPESLGEGNGNPLQYSCLENSRDRGAWPTTGHGVTKSGTWLSDWHFHFLSDIWTRSWYQECQQILDATMLYSHREETEQEPRLSWASVSSGQQAPLRGQCSTAGPCVSFLYRSRRALSPSHRRR